MIRRLRSQQTLDQHVRYNPSQDEAVESRAGRTGLRVPAADFFRRELHISVEISSDDETLQEAVAGGESDDDEGEGLDDAVNVGDQGEEELQEDRGAHQVAALNEHAAEEVQVGDEEGAAGHPPQGGDRGTVVAEAGGAAVDPAVPAEGGEVVQMEEGRMRLADWLEPVVPLPVQQLPQDTDGWEQVTALGGWSCALSTFQPMEAVPGALREKWGKVVAGVLRKALEARSREEKDCALLWFLLLPQVMLRQGKRGGKRGQGVAEVGRRFDCALSGDWKGLLDQLMVDKEEQARRRVAVRRQRPEDEGKEKEKLREKVLDLMSKGQVGRGARRIQSNGVANISDPHTLDTLLSKYVDRSRELPETVTKGECIDNLVGLREVMLDLEPGVCPGTGGMRNEFLVCLAEVWNDEEMQLLQDFGMQYLTAKLPPWFSRVWGTVAAVPLFKTDEKDASKLRPIGVKGALPRVFHKTVARRNRPTLRRYLEPQQLCCTPAGGHKLVHSVRMLMEANRGWVCTKLDFENAHNTISRASIVEVAEAEPALRHLAQYLGASLAPPSALEVKGRVVGEAGDGLNQGDGFASGAFAIGLQPDVQRVDQELVQGGGCALFGNDDGYLMGPPETVFPALQRFEEATRRRCGLKLQRAKTEVFCWGELPEDTPADLRRAGVVVDGVFAPGMECYRVAVGTDRFVRNFLDKKVEELAKVALASTNLLEADLQALWTLLSASISQKMSFLTSLQYPSDIRAAADRADVILWELLEAATGLCIPRREEGLGVECVLAPPVTALQQSSYQEILVRLPVRRGGLGLRSILDTSAAGFVGSVEMSLPHLGGEEGVCRQLEGVLGDLHSREDGTRWEPLLASDARTGVELETAWRGLQEEARQAAAYLGEEVAVPLATPVAGLGEGCVTGHTRALVVEQRERLRARVLEKALQEHPNRAARPVTVYPQLDKLSQAWILATPSPATHLPSPIFREHMAAHLCLPSPACRSLVGKPVGQEGQVVDKFGDTILCAKLCFDTWRHKHDDVKLALVERAHHAHVDCDAEVFGLFRHLVPAVAMERGGEMEFARARNGKVPDLAFRLPVPPGPNLRGRGNRNQGQTTRQLAELKIINAGPSRYPEGSRDKAVDRRARLVPGEYRRALASLDSRFHGTGPREVGPLQRRLEEVVGDSGLQCLVVGRWAEGSQHLHSLVQALGEARALHQARTTGVPTTAGDLATIIGRYRRILSCAFVRATESCLLARLGHLDAGAREAAQRRQVAVREEERDRREEAAHFQAYVRGRGGPRRGRLSG